MTTWIESRAVLLAAACVGAGGAHAAQAADAVALEEVIVTAQKRDESIQDVPIAITAFSAERLAASGITSSDEIQRLTPSLTWNPAGGAGSSVGLRGIVDINFTTGQVGSVGIVVDEVGLNSPVVNTFALLDLERVEVLRGPQVTLYGRSTPGGAINIITRRPQVGGGTSGSFSVTLGNYDERAIEAAFGTELGDRAAIRVAGLATSRDGIFDNLTLGTTDSDRERRMARLSFAAELTDSLDLFTSAHLGRRRGESLRYKQIGYGLPSDPETPCGRPLRVGNGCADLTGFVDSADFDKNFSNFPNPVEEIDASGGLVNLTWDLGTMRLTSISAYEENSIARNEDTDGGPANLLDVSIVADTDQISQEFRLASSDDEALRWIVGAFYMQEDQDGITTVALRDFDVFISTAYDQTDTIYSGYAQVDYDFSDEWSITVGGRYSNETKDGKGNGLAAFDDLVGRGIPPIGVLIDTAAARSFADPDASAVVPFDQTWSDAGGKFGVNYEPSQDVLLYASVAHGFKGGAINLAAGPVLANPPEAELFARGVDPEKVTTYEIGAKTRFLEETMQLNVAAFHNDYKDQQLFLLIDGLAALYNADSSTIDGLEAEWQWSPAQGTLLLLTAAYLDATYDRLVTDAGNFSGNRMVQTPEFSGVAAVRQEWDLGAGLLSVDLSASYADEQYYDLANLLSEGSRTTTDARLEYAFGDERSMRATLWGKNLSDERFCINAADLGVQAAQCLVNEPRTYGVTFSARF
jgi:iron complex outermembrane recepter protein